MNYKIEELEQLKSELNTLQEMGVGYWNKDEWLKIMIKLTDDLFALRVVGVRSEQLHSEVFNLANKLATNGYGDEAVRMHGICNGM